MYLESLVHTFQCHLVWIVVSTLLNNCYLEKIQLSINLVKEYFFIALAAIFLFFFNNFYFRYFFIKNEILQSFVVSGVWYKIYISPVISTLRFLYCVHILHTFTQKMRSTQFLFGNLHIADIQSSMQ